MGSPAERSFALLLFLLGELCLGDEMIPFAAMLEAALLLAVFLILEALAPIVAGEAVVRALVASLPASIGVSVV